MKMLITLACDNAAFEDTGDPTPEVSRILRDLAKRIDGNRWFDPGYSMPLRDINGNEVGYMGVYES